jgi:hypothetical protein
MWDINWEWSDYLWNNDGIGGKWVGSLMCISFCLMGEIVLMMWLLGDIGWIGFWMLEGGVCMVVGWESMGVG